jgi:DNA topoisomerase-1
MAEVVDKPKDPGFDESLRPRARKGLPNAGEWIDMIGKLEEMGGTWDEKNERWVLPAGTKESVADLLDTIGANVIEAPEGMKLADDADRKKFKVPPAWTNAFVAADPDDPDQKYLTMGTDKKGQVQRTRTVQFAAQQDAEKFARVRAFVDALPVIDAALESDTSDTAAAIMLIRKMGLRPGSDRDTGAEVKAYGATNLERRHVTIEGDTVKLSFVGKKGVDIELEMADPQLARALQSRLDGPADGRLFDTNERKANKWLKSVAPGFMAKDFRTALATSEAMIAVDEMPVPTSAQDYKRKRNQIGDMVAGMLGNTRTMALSSYINPDVFAAWEEWAP